MIAKKRALLLIAYFVVIVMASKELRSMIVQTYPGCGGYTFQCPLGCRKVPGEWQDACGNLTSTSCCEYLWRMVACIKGTPPNETLCATGWDLYPQSSAPETNKLCEEISQDCKPIQTTTGPPTAVVSE